jgi:predicted dehydrogenase
VSSGDNDREDEGMRFGYVGLGRATRLYHLPSLGRVAGATAVGGFDADPEQRSAWTTDTGMPAYGSLEELLDQKPDVVVVATPPALHADQCIAALRGGANVFCEKPFTTTTAEADRILAAVAETGRKVAVNHQYREKPIFRVLREKIQSGEFGRLAFCQMWQLMELAPWDEPTPWRAQMARRTLLEGGVHLVDLLIQTFGEQPSAVYARHSAGFHDDADADPVQVVTMEFPGGRLGMVLLDRITKAGTRYLEVRADCEKASLRASHGGRAGARIGLKRAEPTGIALEYGLGGLAWAEIGRRRQVLARGPKEMNVAATGDLLVAAVEAFQSGGEPPSSAREARDVIAVIEAAYESHATGSRIELGSRLLPPRPQTV